MTTVDSFPPLNKKQVVRSPTKPQQQQQQSVSLNVRWAQALRQTVSKMSEKELFTQFIMNYFSDRSLLYMQWCQSLFKNVFFRTKEPLKVYSWFDDILFRPLDFEIVWTIPEMLFSNPAVSLEETLLQYGTIYCFSEYLDTSQTSRKSLSRTIKSLDGFTLMLLTELLLRKKIKFSDIQRPEYGTIQLTLNIHNKKQPLDFDEGLIREARVALFKHLLQMSLVYPFIIVNIPEDEIKLANGRSILEISIVTTMTLLRIFESYLASLLPTGSNQTWLINLYHGLTFLHRRNESGITTFLNSIDCPCHFCILVAALLKTYLVVQFHDCKVEFQSNGTLLLSYYYNKNMLQQRWYSFEDDMEILENYKAKQRVILKQFFADLAKDTLSQRQYAAFREKILEPVHKKQRTSMY